MTAGDVSAPERWTIQGSYREHGSLPVSGRLLDACERVEVVDAAAYDRVVAEVDVLRAMLPVDDLVDAPRTEGEKAALWFSQPEALAAERDRVVAERDEMAAAGLEVARGLKDERDAAAVLVLRYRERWRDLRREAAYRQANRMALGPAAVLEICDAALAEGEQPAGDPNRPHAMRWDGSRESISAICRWANADAEDPDADDPTVSYLFRAADDAFDVQVWSTIPGGPVGMEPGDWVYRRADGEFEVLRPLTDAPAAGVQSTTDTGAEACRRCGRSNVSWCAPSPLWNAAVRAGQPEDARYGELLCMGCFAEIAERRGVASGWRLDATDVQVELETVSPSGRVWNPETWLWEDPPAALQEEDLRLLALLDDGEFDPTDPRYEEFCERGLVRFSSRYEGWELTDAGRRVVDAHSSPSTTETATHHEYSLIDAVLPAVGDRRAWLVRAMANDLAADHDADTANEWDREAEVAYDALREALPAAPATPESESVTPSVRLARWLDQDPGRSVRMVDDHDEWYCMLWDPGVGNTTGHGDTRDEAITAALDQAEGSTARVAESIEQAVRENPDDAGTGGWRTELNAAVDEMVQAEGVRDAD
jgi:hypothetical protein